MGEKYKLTEVGEIPVEWEVKKIENSCQIVDYRGKTPQKVDKGILLVTAKNIGKGKIDYKISKEYIKEDDYEKVMSRGTPKMGDVLFTTEAPLGNVANVDKINIALAQRVIKFRGNTGIINNYFLKYYMLSNKFQKEINNEATGSTVLGIKGSRLKKINLLIPPINQQQKIADILSVVDEKIENTDNLIEKTKELKKGLMQRLFTKGIGHDRFKDTEIGRIPQEWDVNSLCGAVSINPESLNNRTEDDYIINYIDIESVSIGKVNSTKAYSFRDSPSRARRIVRKNDVIISTVRPYLRAFAMIKDSREALICSTGFAVLRSKKEIEPNYLYQFILSDIFLSQLLNKMVGSNYPAVNSSDIKETLIVIPKIAEQNQIALILTSVDEKIQQYETKKEKLQQLKKGLMQKLLTGKIRVTV